jgi:LssY C-terminus
VESALAGAPQRAVSKDGKPGDPINLVLVGTTAQQIEQAFRTTGWGEPQRKTGKALFDTARAMANNEGYGLAPVSDLYVYGRREDLAFEKVLNTFNKRHHLRLWQTPVKAPDGRPIWLGAATHDTGIDIHPGVVSHATDPDLDDERNQVQADLGGAAQEIQLVTPPSPLRTGRTATGGAWHTDGRLLVVDLKPATTSALNP